MTDHRDVNLITTLAALEAINGRASKNTMVKKLPRLEKHSIDFLERSPFAILATSSADGTDASPRGDAPGFAQVLDDRTLLIAERPGNRIADSLRNIVANPDVGLLFLIPGMNETLRINGQAYITDHGDYLQRLVHRDKTPKLALLIEIQELYLHCAKAFIRSALWNPEKYMERSELPSLGKMILEQITGKPIEAEQLARIDADLKVDSESNLY